MESSNDVTMHGEIQDGHCLFAHIVTSLLLSNNCS